MSWIYEQSTGKFYNPKGECVSTGYAGGNEGKNPEGKNNPAMDGVKQIGPLPAGKYTHGEAIDHSHLGAFAIPLIPDPLNDMKGRGDFFLHGDTVPSGNASEGCIIQPPQIRHDYYESDDGVIEVVAVNIPPSVLNDDSTTSSV